MVGPALSTNTPSSSSKLWATASKEWVIAPKPKPGRKPKKDLTTPAKSEEDTQLDTKGRRVQNRAAQRAFRERKQSQLAELQARLQSYEQGEIERNVALQNIAKRLKEENESLRAENAALKEKLLNLGQSQMIRENDKKRWRDDSPPSNPASKRIKPVHSPHSDSSPFTVSYTSSPPSMVSSPDSASDTSCSPLSNYDVQQESQTSISNILDFSSVKPTHIDHTDFSTFDCGFCNEDTPCVCRELVTQQAQAMERLEFKPVSSYTQATPVLQQATIQLEPPTSPQHSILDNLPPYQPPVPLRRRSVVSSANSIFAIAPSGQQGSPASCSGDPSNCLACADDAFGKAFCSAIEESVVSQNSCVDCPCSQNPSPRDNFSRPMTCRELPSRDSTVLYATSGSLPLTEPSTPETMPTNDAWQQIKSHPNVAFADLRLLAEVVARRSKCTGPRVVISPAPGSITPERTVSPGANIPAENEPILLTDPHAHYREKERERSNDPSSSPRLVPQDVLIRCGRQRIREVQTDAVHAALRLLDGKFV